jgi:ABC-2 type transport system ATP-binding protein
MTIQYAVEIVDATKQIRNDSVLRAINLRVLSGTICGITGHNGSGKSMLLRAITGLVRLTSGEVRIFGQPIGQKVEFAPETGAVIDIPGFLPGKSGIQNLELLAMIRNKITKHEVVEAMLQVGLDPNNKRPFRTYSTGMRQRLGIAQAIMEHPRLILLDEPTRGIDVEGHKQIYDLILKLKRQETTLILTSHYSNELSDLCDDVYVMNQGQLMQVTSLQNK